MTLYRRVRDITVENPVLLVGLEGWIDGGFGGTNAFAAIRQSIETETVVVFDGDVLLDYRARRPTLHIESGVSTGITWPEIELRAGTDARGNDVLLLVGPEPDTQWRAFTKAVCDIASAAGVRLAVGLGAFPAPVPHTRPVRLAATATTPELAGQVGFVQGTIDVPAGIASVINRGLHLAGIPAIGLWARVPMYVAGSAYPAASVALLDGLERVAGIATNASELRAAAETSLVKIAELIAQSDEHAAMVAGLERQADAESEAASPAPFDPDSLPSGDEIAAELERFLRQQRPGGDSSG